jgi:hypothetical protein
MAEHKIGDLVVGTLGKGFVLGFINGVKSGNVRCFSIDWNNDRSDIEFIYSLSDVEGFKELLEKYVDV